MSLPHLDTGVFIFNEEAREEARRWEEGITEEDTLEHLRTRTPRWLGIWRETEPGEGRDILGRLLALALKHTPEVCAEISTAEREEIRAL